MLISVEAYSDRTKLVNWPSHILLPELTVLASVLRTENERMWKEWRFTKEGGRWGEKTTRKDNSRSPWVKICSLKRNLVGTNFWRSTSYPEPAIGLLITEVWPTALWASLRLPLKWRLVLTGERERKADAPSLMPSAARLVKELSRPK